MRWHLTPAVLKITIISNIYAVSAGGGANPPAAACISLPGYEFPGNNT
jgi:hypothetical protein